MESIKPRHIMHQGKHALLFMESTLRVHLYYKWKGIRSGKYVLNQAWKCEYNNSNINCADVVGFEPFPSNWRLSRNDRDFIDKELNKNE